VKPNEPTINEEIITLEEQSSRPKLNNINVESLENQINKSSGDEEQSEDCFEAKNKSSPVLKSVLKKPGSRSQKSGKIIKEIARKPNYKSQKFLEESSSEEVSVSRKRKYQEFEDSNQLSTSLQKDLQESVVPVSKRGLKNKRAKRKSSDVGKEVNLEKAKKRKLKSIQKA